MGTAAMGSYWKRRLTRQGLLVAAAVAITAATYAMTPPPDFRHRLSLSTAYAALMFLAASLAVGPWRVLRRQANPVSYDFRRDLGIATGILALLHTAIGLTVHLRGRMWMYFLRRLHPPALQNTTFGFANYTGGVAAILFLVLLAISNDLSLRHLGLQRWKSVQRWAYAAFALTVAHGVAFQVVEKRHVPWVAFFWAVIGSAILLQMTGFLLVRRAARGGTA
ncbi:MAG TPA: ferric reductase-like transmembrane domain-containing protein [Acidobacteriaceae bacterium]|nr:ferric reductase-like transmembrane domain-containing protein [Acidobacteriaceae bacterium]